MKNIKKLVALGLAAVLTLGVVACGGGEGDNQQGGNGGGAAAGGNTAKNEEIIIGSWWVQYYDSTHTSVEDDPSYVTSVEAEGDTEDQKKQKAINRQVADMKFANVDKIEQAYDVEFYWSNLTYTGVSESITTSIMAGTPDCDIYLVDAGMAIPAQMNGLALDLKTVLPADNDLFTTQSNIAYLDLGDGKACILSRQEAQKQVEATYPLGFNMQMLEENKLEDPRVLYERGEWTWDKFNEYCQKLTQDTDGDGQIDQYGYCGYEYETFEQLMMSNGASIALGTTETLTSAATGQAIQQMYDMYNTWKVCYPYDFEDPSNSMRNQYTQGNIAFFPIAAWIASGNGDYDYDGALGYTLPFDTAYVRWPVGPSGNKDTNPGKNNVSGEFYIIPAGVAEPEKVYNVLYDMWNWYDGDTSIRDNRDVMHWWFGVTASKQELRDANFEVMADCGAHTTLDLWNSMGVAYDLQSIIKGEATAAQFQETYKQQVQDALDAYFN
ncbi:MAG: extracellular solute-binding protein [Lachnospiraceae bacterium]|nr:extracellular solute-binding protein [Lachnospiraceae bacterium]